jgi:spermidine synthase
MATSFLTYPIRSDKLTITVKIENRLLHRKTPFQTIDIVQTEAFGRMLFLDGHVQLAELDEHVYHECLVHIPLLNVQRARTALVVGGGDGACLRELCRWPLERIDLVEIDAGVIAASREAWPALSSGAFDDPRVCVHIEDAFQFVERARIPRPPAPSLSRPDGLQGEGEGRVRAFDLIVLDATDVYETEDSSLSETLFTTSFYRACRELLSESGFLVIQADNPIFCPYSLQAIRAELATVFEHTGAYVAPVPSFGGSSAFCWASQGAEIATSLPEAEAAPRFRYLNHFRYSQAMAELAFTETGRRD